MRADFWDEAIERLTKLLEAAWGKGYETTSEVTLKDAAKAVASTLNREPLRLTITEGQVRHIERFNEDTDGR